MVDKIVFDLAMRNFLRTLKKPIVIRYPEYKVEIRISAHPITKVKKGGKGGTSNN